MPGQRERLQVLAIRALHLGPLLDLGLSHCHQCLGLCGVRRRGEPFLETGEGLRGLREFLLGLSHVLANGQRIALDDVRDDMEEIWHAEALQPLLGQLDQGVRAVTDQVPHTGSEDLEPLLQQRLPGGLGPILCHRFQEQIPRGQVQTDQHHPFSEGFIDGANDLSSLSPSTPVLLPSLCSLQQRGLQRLPHLA